MHWELEKEQRHEKIVSICVLHMLSIDFFSSSDFFFVILSALFKINKSLMTSFLMDQGNGRH